MVSLRVDIKKKDLWLLSAIVVFMVGVGFVISYNPSGSGGTPSIMGHSPDELEGVCKTDGTGCPSLGSSSGGLASGERVFDGGHEHMCAVINDGTVRCWGRNDYGQLGDGATTTRYAPFSVSGISNAIQVSAGELFTCALLSDGSVKCWGRNGYGEIGDGTKTNRNTPVTVLGLTDAVQIEVSDYRTACALLFDGTIKCWGYNGHGEIGDGTVTARSSPVTVSGITNANKVDCGGYHCCALLDTGSMKCWGYNSYGMLGDGTTTKRTTPVTVSGISTAIDIGVGSYQSCAILDDKTVRCWGYNNYGQLGDGTTTTRNTPVVVSGLTAAEKIDVDRGNSLSHGHACVVLTDGSAKCWGYNGYGQLAEGTTLQRYTSTNVYGLGDISDVNSGFGSTCFSTNDNALYCVGNNNYGQIGIGEAGNRRSLQRVLI